MTKDEALKLALHGLEIGLPLIEDFGSTEQFNAQHKATAAIYEALAQPEQDGECKYCTDGCPACDARKLPPQRTWVGLTDEEMRSLLHLATYMDVTDYIHMLMMAEDKLKEKNT